MTTRSTSTTVRLGVRIARKHIAWMIDAAFGAPAREIAQTDLHVRRAAKQVRERRSSNFVRACTDWIGTRHERS
jgi:hypothetical protein